MGYPMTYKRVVWRNLLGGGYSHDPDDTTVYSRGAGTKPELAAIAGDMRRLERDTMDDAHLELYAKVGGTDRLAVMRIFDAFFAGDVAARAHRLAGKASHD